MRAAELGETYLKLDAEGRRRYLEILADAFAVDETALGMQRCNRRRRLLRRLRYAAQWKMVTGMSFRRIDRAAPAGSTATQRARFGKIREQP